jgi:hypothetical protein
VSAIEYWFLGLLAAFVIATAVLYAQRIRDIERKVTLLLAHFKIDPTSSVEPSSHVRSLAADPHKLTAAIKAYRAETGADLKEAAAVINKLSA